MTIFKLNNIRIQTLLKDIILEFVQPIFGWVL